MISFKRILRIAGLVIFLFLALIGVGISGVAPVPPKNKDKIIDHEVKTELVEEADTSSGALNILKLKQ